MSFLHPWALALAALAAAPILLHLLRREVAQRIPFPALRYLRRAERRTARSMRLRDQLLLLTRILLVVLLAAAAARPFAGRGGARDHEPTDVLLIIDNSASMGRVQGDRTLLAHQVDAARATLTNAGPADRFWVAPLIGPVVAAGVSGDEAMAALESVESTDAGGDIVGRLDELTASVPVLEDRAREAHVYSDGQASALGGASLDLSAWGPVLLGVPGRSETRNGAVTRLRLEPDGPVVPGDPAAVAAMIGRSGDVDATADTVDVRLIVDGQTAAMSRTMWGSEAMLALPDLAPGAHTVRVETPPSGLRSDDGRQIGLIAAGSPIVRLSGDPTGFVGVALQTLLAEGRIRAETPGVRADVEIVEGTYRPATLNEAALVLIPPLEFADLPAFQQRLSALGVPWRLRLQPVSGSVAFDEPSQVPGLDQARVSMAYTLERQASPMGDADSVLVRTGDGAAWLVRGQAGSRVFLLFASAIHPEATDLPTGVAMIPFLETLLLHWSRPGAEPTWDVTAGSALALPARAEQVVSPAGDTFSVEGGAPWTPVQAGIWMVQVADDGAGRTIPLGVNVPVA
ncbi:MAG: VWA domain-containing protein, partial [Gemmatimonadota bacterium]|nr:VWA domain-containing protein [Gemmatimonadota bacterium]